MKEDYVSSDGTVNLANAYADASGFATLAIFIQGGADNNTVTTSWFDVSCQSNVFEVSKLLFL